MAGSGKQRHPREKVFCLECGREIEGEAYREYVVTMEGCCGTEVAAFCSPECWDRHSRSRAPSNRMEKG